MMTHAPVLSAVLSVSLALAPAARAASPLPPSAAAHNERGMELYAQDDLEGAYAELARAYAAMPDAKKFDVGRDTVLASMRAALLDLYEKTGEARHLCRARSLLVTHLEALLLAFGEDTTIEDVPGTIWRIEQVEARLRAHAPKPGESSTPCSEAPARTPARKTAPAPRPTPPTRPARDQVRPWTIAGGVTLGLGGALLGAMTYALFMRRASYVAIRQLDALAEARGEATTTELAAAAAYTEVGERHRTLAIATGVSGGMLAAAGVTALLLSQLRSRRSHVAFLPALGPWGASLALRGAF